MNEEKGAGSGGRAAGGAAGSALLDRLVQAGVIPVVRVFSPEVALRVADALVEGGAATVEVTFTVPGAPRVMETLRERYPQTLIGAGTVLGGAEAAAAVEAGAQYLVSPGVQEEVVRAARQAGLPAVAGVMTPTEALRALQLGAEVLKVFPASVLGPGWLRAVREVLPGARWCPTGGVSPDNLAEWVRAGATLVGVGAALLQDVEETGDYAALARRTGQFVQHFRELHRGAQR